jgi:hypothetical protein
MIQQYLRYIYSCYSFGITTAIAYPSSIMMSSSHLIDWNVACCWKFRDHAATAYIHTIEHNSLFHDVDTMEVDAANRVSTEL